MNFSAKKELIALDGRIKAIWIKNLTLKMLITLKYKSTTRLVFLLESLKTKN